MSERIYIPPRKTRLGLDMPRYQWRHVGYLLLACAAVSAVVWWRLA